MEARVEYDYDAENADELTLRTGEVITHVVQKEGGWWEGKLNGKHGVFPDNFVKVLNIKEKGSTSDGKANGIPLRKDKKRKCRVIYSYTPVNEDELELDVDNTIEVLEEVEEGWWKGVLNGRVGVFPSNFVEEMNERTASVPPCKTNKDGADEIKPKPIRGVGLGNIFQDEIIRLKPTQDSPPDRKMASSPISKKQLTTVYPCSVNDAPILPPKPETLFVTSPRFSRTNLKRCLLRTTPRTTPKYRAGSPCPLTNKDPVTPSILSKSQSTEAIDEPRPSSFFQNSISSSSELDLRLPLHLLDLSSPPTDEGRCRWKFLDSDTSSSDDEILLEARGVAEEIEKCVKKGFGSDSSEDSKTRKWFDNSSGDHNLGQDYCCYRSEVVAGKTQGNIIPTARKNEVFRRNNFKSNNECFKAICYSDSVDKDDDHATKLKGKDSPEHVVANKIRERFLARSLCTPPFYNSDYLSAASLSCLKSLEDDDESRHDDGDSSPKSKFVKSLPLETDTVVHRVSCSLQPHMTDSLPIEVQIIHTVKKVSATVANVNVNRFRPLSDEIAAAELCYKKSKTSAASGVDSPGTTGSDDYASLINEIQKHIEVKMTNLQNHYMQQKTDCVYETLYDEPASDLCVSESVSESDCSSSTSSHSTGPQVVKPTVSCPVPLQTFSYYKDEFRCKSGICGRTAVRAVSLTSRVTLKNISATQNMNSPDVLGSTNEFASTQEFSPCSCRSPVQSVFTSEMLLPVTSFDNSKPDLPWSESIKLSTYPIYSWEIDESPSCIAYHSTYISSYEEEMKLLQLFRNDGYLPSRLPVFGSINPSNGSDKLIEDVDVMIDENNWRKRGGCNDRRRSLSDSQLLNGRFVWGKDNVAVLIGLEQPQSSYRMESGDDSKQKKIKSSKKKNESSSNQSQPRKKSSNRSQPRRKSSSNRSQPRRKSSSARSQARRKSSPSQKKAKSDKKSEMEQQKAPRKQDKQKKQKKSKDSESDLARSKKKKKGKKEKSAAESSPELGCCGGKKKKKKKKPKSGKTKGKHKKGRTNASDSDGGRQSRKKSDASDSSFASEDDSILTESPNKNSPTAPAEGRGRGHKKYDDKRSSHQENTFPDDSIKTRSGAKKSRKLKQTPGPPPNSPDYRDEPGHLRRVPYGIESCGYGSKYMGDSSLYGSTFLNGNVMNVESSMVTALQVKDKIADSESNAAKLLQKNVGSQVQTELLELNDSTKTRMLLAESEARCMLESEKTRMLLEESEKARMLLEESERARMLEESEKARMLEELEKAKMLEELEKARMLEELEKARMLEELEKARMLEELEKARMLEELEKARMLEELEKTRTLLEEAEKARMLEELERARMLEELEKARVLEELEKARMLEELEKARMLEELEKARSLLEEAEKSRTVLEEAEKARSLEEAEKARRLEEAEKARRLEEAEKARRLGDAEKARHLEEAEKCCLQEAEKARKYEKEKMVSVKSEGIQCPSVQLTCSRRRVADADGVVMDERFACMHEGLDRHVSGISKVNEECVKECIMSDDDEVAEFRKSKSLKDERRHHIKSFKPNLSYQDQLKRRDKDRMDNSFEEVCPQWHVQEDRDMIWQLQHQKQAQWEKQHRSKSPSLYTLQSVCDKRTEPQEKDGMDCHAEEQYLQQTDQRRRFNKSSKDPSSYAEARLNDEHCEENAKKAKSERPKEIRRMQDKICRSAKKKDEQSLGSDDWESSLTKERSTRSYQKADAEPQVGKVYRIPKKGKNNFRKESPLLYEESIDSWMDKRPRTKKNWHKEAKIVTPSKSLDDSLESWQSYDNEYESHKQYAEGVISDEEVYFQSPTVKTVSYTRDDSNASLFSEEETSLKRKKRVNDKYHSFKEHSDEITRRPPPCPPGLMRRFKLDRHRQQHLADVKNQVKRNDVTTHSAKFFPNPKHDKRKKINEDVKGVKEANPKMKYYKSEMELYSPSEVYISPEYDKKRKNNRTRKSEVIPCRSDERQDHKLRYYGEEESDWCPHDENDQRAGEEKGKGHNFFVCAASPVPHQCKLAKPCPFSNVDAPPLMLCEETTMVTCDDNDLSCCSMISLTNYDACGAQESNAGGGNKSAKICPKHLLTKCPAKMRSASQSEYRDNLQDEKLYSTQRSDYCDNLRAEKMCHAQYSECLGNPREEKMHLPQRMEYRDNLRERKIYPAKRIEYRDEECSRPSRDMQQSQSCDMMDVCGYCRKCLSSSTGALPLDGGSESYFSRSVIPIESESESSDSCIACPICDFQKKALLVKSKNIGRPYKHELPEVQYDSKFIGQDWDMKKSCSLTGFLPKELVICVDRDEGVEQKPFIDDRVKWKPRPASRIPQWEESKTTFSSGDQSREKPKDVYTESHPEFIREKRARGLARLKKNFDKSLPSGHQPEVARVQPQDQENEAKSIKRRKDQGQRKRVKCITKSDDLKEKTVLVLCPLTSNHKSICLSTSDGRLRLGLESKERISEDLSGNHSPLLMKDASVSTVATHVTFAEASQQTQTLSVRPCLTSSTVKSKSPIRSILSSSVRPPTPRWRSSAEKANWKCLSDDTAIESSSMSEKIDGDMAAISPPIRKQTYVVIPQSISSPESPEDEVPVTPKKVKKCADFYERSTLDSKSYFTPTIPKKRSLPRMGVAGIKRTNLLSSRIPKFENKTNISPLLQKRQDGNHQLRVRVTSNKLSNVVESSPKLTIRFPQHPGRVADVERQVDKNEQPITQPQQSPPRPRARCLNSSLAKHSLVIPGKVASTRTSLDRNVLGTTPASPESAPDLEIKSSPSKSTFTRPTVPPRKALYTDTGQKHVSICREDYSLCSSTKVLPCSEILSNFKNVQETSTTDECNVHGTHTCPNNFRSTLFAPEENVRKSVNIPSPCKKMLSKARKMLPIHEHLASTSQNSKSPLLGRTANDYNKHSEVSKCISDEDAGLSASVDFVKPCSEHAKVPICPSSEVDLHHRHISSPCSLAKTFTLVPLCTDETKSRSPSFLPCPAHLKQRNIVRDVPHHHHHSVSVGTTCTSSRFVNESPCPLQCESKEATVEHVCPNLTYPFCRHIVPPTYYNVQTSTPENKSIFAKRNRSKASVTVLPCIENTFGMEGPSKTSSEVRLIQYRSGLEEMKLVSDKYGIDEMKFSCDSGPDYSCSGKTRALKTPSDARSISFWSGLGEIKTVSDKYGIDETKPLCKCGLDRPGSGKMSLSQTSFEPRSISFRSGLEEMKSVSDKYGMDEMKVLHVSGSDHAETDKIKNLKTLSKGRSIPFRPGLEEINSSSASEKNEIKSSYKCGENHPSSGEMRASRTTDARSTSFKTGLEGMKFPLNKLKFFRKTCMDDINSASNKSGMDEIQSSLKSGMDEQKFSLKSGMDERKLMAYKSGGDEIKTTCNSGSDEEKYYSQKPGSDEENALQKSDLEVNVAQKFGNDKCGLNEVKPRKSGLDLMKVSCKSGMDEMKCPYKSSVDEMKFFRKRNIDEMVSLPYQCNVDKSGLDERRLCKSGMDEMTTSSHKSTMNDIKSSVFSKKTGIDEIKSLSQKSSMDGNKSFSKKTGANEIVSGMDEMKSLSNKSGTDAGIKFSHTSAMDEIKTISIKSGADGTKFSCKSGMDEMVSSLSNKSDVASSFKSGIDETQKLLSKKAGIDEMKFSRKTGRDEMLPSKSGKDETKSFLNKTGMDSKLLLGKSGKDETKSFLNKTGMDSKLSLGKSVVDNSLVLPSCESDMDKKKSLSNKTAAMGVIQLSSRSAGMDETNSLSNKAGTNGMESLSNKTGTNEKILSSNSACMDEMRKSPRKVWLNENRSSVITAVEGEGHSSGKSGKSEATKSSKISVGDVQHGPGLDTACSSNASGLAAAKSSLKFNRDEPKFCPKANESKSTCKSRCEQNLNFHMNDLKSPQRRGLGEKMKYDSNLSLNVRPNSQSEKGLWTGKKVYSHSSYPLTTEKMNLREKATGTIAIQTGESSTAKVYHKDQRDESKSPKIEICSLTRVHSIPIAISNKGLQYPSKSSSKRSGHSATSKIPLSKSPSSRQTPQKSPRKHFTDSLSGRENQEAAEKFDHKPHLIVDFCDKQEVKPFVPIKANRSTSTSFNLQSYPELVETTRQISEFDLSTSTLQHTRKFDVDLESDQTAADCTSNTSGSFPAVADCCRYQSDNIIIKSCRNTDTSNTNTPEESKTQAYDAEKWKIICAEANKYWSPDTEEGIRYYNKNVQESSTEETSSEDDSPRSTKSDIPDLFTQLLDKLVKMLTAKKTQSLPSIISTDTPPHVVHRRCRDPQCTYFEKRDSSLECSSEVEGNSCTVIEVTGDSSDQQFRKRKAPCVNYLVDTVEYDDYQEWKKATSNRLSAGMGKTYYLTNIIRIPRSGNEQSSTPIKAVCEASNSGNDIQVTTLCQVDISDESQQSNEVKQDLEALSSSCKHDASLRMSTKAHSSTNKPCISLGQSTSNKQSTGHPPVLMTTPSMSIKHNTSPETPSLFIEPNKSSGELVGCCSPEMLATTVPSLSNKLNDNSLEALVSPSCLSNIPNKSPKIPTPSLTVVEWPNNLITPRKCSVYQAAVGKTSVENWLTNQQKWCSVTAVEKEQQHPTGLPPKNPNRRPSVFKTKTWKRFSEFLRAPIRSNKQGLDKRSDAGTQTGVKAGSNCNLKNVMHRAKMVTESSSKQEADPIVTFRCGRNESADKSSTEKVYYLKKGNQDDSNNGGEIENSARTEPKKRCSVINADVSGNNSNFLMNPNDKKPPIPARKRSSSIKWQNLTRLSRRENASRSSLLDTPRLDPARKGAPDSAQVDQTNQQPPSQRRCSVGRCPSTANFSDPDRLRGGKNPSGKQQPKEEDKNKAPPPEGARQLLRRAQNEQGPSAEINQPSTSTDGQQNSSEKYRMKLSLLPIKFGNDKLRDSKQTDISDNVHSKQDGGRLDKKCSVSDQRHPRPRSAEPAVPLQLEKKCSLTRVKPKDEPISIHSPLVTTTWASCATSTSDLTRTKLKDANVGVVSQTEYSTLIAKCSKLDQETRDRCTVGSNNAEHSPLSSTVLATPKPMSDFSSREEWSLLGELSAAKGKSFSLRTSKTAEIETSGTETTETSWTPEYFSSSVNPLRAATERTMIDSGTSTKDLHKPKRKIWPKSFSASVLPDHPSRHNTAYLPESYFVHLAQTNRLSPSIRDLHFRYGLFRRMETPMESSDSEESELNACFVNESVCTAFEAPANRAANQAEQLDADDCEKESKASGS